VVEDAELRAVTQVRWRSARTCHICFAAVISRGMERLTAYDSFDGIPSATRDGLACAYQRVFAKPPWKERWERTQVLTKLRRDLASGNAFLSVLAGDATDPVAGFCWGASVSPARARDRVRAARPMRSHAALAEIVLRLRARVLFVDEIAVLPRFRGGLTPLLQLVLPVAEIAAAEGLPVVCWSNERARIVPILLEYFGFDDLGRVDELRFFQIGAENAPPWLRKIQEALGLPQGEAGRE